MFGVGGEKQRARLQALICLHTRVSASLPPSSHTQTYSYIRQENVSFIPNDYALLPGESHFTLLTGPNMGGKSTYIRALGCLVVMAQVCTCLLWECWGLNDMHER